MNERWVVHGARRLGVMKPGPGLRALGFAALVGVVLGSLHLLGVELQLWLATLFALLFVTLLLPNYISVRWLDAIILWARSRYWAAHQGRFHSFGGVSLRIDDDGRYVWVDGVGLQRALRTRDAEDVLAARLPGHWRRDADGELLLRVDAVVRHLATMPGRDASRVQRLRRYFEREVFFPAQERRKRA